jgi:hypothetical protein
MDKIKRAIERYLLADTTRKAAAAKGAITRLANDLAIEFGVVVARKKVWEALDSFVEVPDWMFLRFTPGSFYQEGDRIMGWWDEGEIQLQAEALPLHHYGNVYSVSFFGRSDEAPLWELKGFYVAQDLPIKFYRESIQVSFNIRQTLTFLEQGYALPCDLQWQWEQGEEFRVSRSIISCGFWQAWKWWEGAKWWYLDHRPELFVDLDWWGEEPAPQRFEPEDDPYAAVLGGQG